MKKNVNNLRVYVQFVCVLIIEFEKYNNNHHWEMFIVIFSNPLYYNKTYWASAEILIVKTACKLFSTSLFVNNREKNLCFGSLLAYCHSYCSQRKIYTPQTEIRVWFLFKNSCKIARCLLLRLMYVENKKMNLFTGILSRQWFNIDNKI